MGDDFENQSGFNNAYQKAVHNRLSHEPIFVPPTVASGDGTIPTTPGPASNGTGDGSLPAAANPAAQGNQEDPQQVLNNRGSAYNPPQKFAVAEDPNEIARENRAKWARSNGAPAFYSQTHPGLISGRLDPNVQPSPLLGINLGRYDGGGAISTYKQVEQASQVNPYDHATMDAAAATLPTGLGFIHPTRVLSGEVICNAGFMDRLGSAGNKALAAVGISETFNWLEHFARQAHKDITIPLANVTVNTSDAFRPTPWERLGEGFLTWFALIKTDKIPGWVKWGAAGIVYLGCRVSDGVTKKHSELLDALNKSTNDLKEDYVDRTANSMRKAIGAYVNYAIHHYQSFGDPKEHEEISIGNLKAIAENWDTNNKDGDGRQLWKYLYRQDNGTITDEDPRIKDPNAKVVDKEPDPLEKLRGGIIVKTALADALMKKPAFLANPNKPDDCLDFGCAAMKSLFNAKKNLQECVEITKAGDGHVSDDKVVNAANEIADLREIEKQEIDHRLQLIQYGQPDQSGKPTGHDIVAAFNQLANKDSRDSQLLKVESGTQTALIETMQSEAERSKHTKDPYTQVIASKQFRDLAVWQLANLTLMGTASIDHFNTPDEAQQAINKYKFALDFLTEASNLCPNVASNPNQASGQESYTRLNPDLANIEQVAKVLAGIERSSDQQLQATANRIAGSGIQVQLAALYKGYEDSISGADQASVESGGIHPLLPGEPSEDLIPQGGTRVLQAKEEYEQQQADEVQQQKIDDQFRAQAGASQAQQAAIAQQQAAASRQAWAQQQGQYPPAGQYTGDQDGSY